MANQPRTDDITASIAYNHERARREELAAKNETIRNLRYRGGLIATQINLLEASVVSIQANLKGMGDYLGHHGANQEAVAFTVTILDDVAQIRCALAAMGVESASD